MAGTATHTGPFISRLIVSLCAVTFGHACFADEPGAPPARPSFLGKIVFFGNRTHDERHLIETMELDGTRLRTVLELKEIHMVMPGRVSPDGKSLAFIVDPGPGARPALWVLSVDGRHDKLVEEAGVNVGSVAAWSPDGKRIAYNQSNDNAEYENLIVDLASRKIQRLEMPRGDYSEDWSPDGRAISVIDFSGKDSDRPRSLYLIKPDGTRLGSLTNDPQRDSIWSRFSPNGRQVAYEQRYSRRGKTVLSCFVANGDGSNPREVFCFDDLGEGFVIDPNGPPCWSPDGKTIIWKVLARPSGSEVLGNCELLFAAADGSKIRRIPLSSLERRWWAWIDCR
ncbi:MAG: PD40 domain-containing protein [Planctomycetia bacterium]|nr:PD40 domain-containing protein [Planctomycetia bacterium]